MYILKNLFVSSVVDKNRLSKFTVLHTALKSEISSSFLTLVQFSYRGLGIYSTLWPQYINFNEGQLSVACISRNFGSTDSWKLRDSYLPYLVCWVNSISSIRLQFFFDVGDIFLQRESFLIPIYFQCYDVKR